MWFRSNNTGFKIFKNQLQTGCDRIIVKKIFPIQKKTVFLHHYFLKKVRT
jgi:hypothetical protein